LEKPQVLNGGCLKTSSTYQGFLKPQVYHFLLEVVIPPTKKPQVKLCFFVVSDHLDTNLNNKKVWLLR